MIKLYASDIYLAGFNGETLKLEEVAPEFRSPEYHSIYRQITERGLKSWIGERLLPDNRGDKATILRALGVDPGAPDAWLQSALRTHCRNVDDLFWIITDAEDFLTEYKKVF